VIYEWPKIDPKTKQPFAIALRDNSIFAFAGLWERWKDKATGQRLHTYTIVTTDPNVGAEIECPVSKPER
jgi:putative SOS response-associated peptidase YedK